MSSVSEGGNASAIVRADAGAEERRIGQTRVCRGQDRTALLGVRGVRGTGEVDAALALAEAFVEL